MRHYDEDDNHYAELREEDAARRAGFTDWCEDCEMWVREVDDDLICQNCREKRIETLEYVRER